MRWHISTLDWPSILQSTSEEILQEQQLTCAGRQDLPLVENALVTMMFTAWRCLKSRSFVCESCVLLPMARGVVIGGMTFLPSLTTFAKAFTGKSGLDFLAKIQDD